MLDERPAQSQNQGLERDRVEGGWITPFLPLSVVQDAADFVLVPN